MPVLRLALSKVINFHHLVFAANSNNNECDSISASGLDIFKSKWENLSALDQIDRRNELCVMNWMDDSEDAIVYGTRGGLVRKLLTESLEVKDVFCATNCPSEVLKGLFMVNK